MHRVTIAGLLLAGVSALLAAAPAAKDEQGGPVPIGVVPSINLGDDELSKERFNQLHFCVFENGKDDFIYVGTRHGMWSNGEFDLSIDGERVFTGRVPHLVYRGAIIKMGDVLDEQPRGNAGVEITRITGTFK